jgi:hypothetical protein
MGDNSFGNGIGTGCIHLHAEWCADTIPLASTVHEMINNSFTQSIIHVSIELERLVWGTIPSALALALATPISMPSGVPMPFHWPPHYTKR